jgi:hypothetical protein
VKLTKVTLFAAGYVIGARAGRERYAQILGGLETASQRLEAFSARRPPSGREKSAPDAERGSRSPQAPL